MKNFFLRKWRWIAGIAAIWLVFCALGPIALWLKLNDPGPTADYAFQWYIKDPIPKSVTGLRIHYTPHMHGYWMYLVFSIAPEDLTSLFDLHESTDPVPSATTDGVTEYSDWTDGFRTLDPEGFGAMMTTGSVYSQHTLEQASSLYCMVVVSADHRKVYYYRFRD